MSGICDTCSLSKGCRKPIGGVDSCRRYVMRKESNYEKLFGTPERAARTLSITAKCFKPVTACRDCMYKSYCNTQCDYNALLELLGG